MCFGAKSKNSTTRKQKIKHKNPWWSRESNPRPLALKAELFENPTSGLKDGGHDRVFDLKT